ncbi:transcriptional regulator GcvA [Pseudochelatococcus sp. B33]
MMKRLPPLNPLRAFEATARHGSLSKAAVELNVTHGAISHQIRALERSLGVVLFERAGHRLRLSPHGAELLPAVSSAFDSIAAATQRLTRPMSSGTLSLSCVPALLSLWVVPRLNRFISKYPDVRLTMTGSNNPLDVHAPEIDVCLHYGTGNWSDCWQRKWSGLELFPVVSPTLINNRPLRTIRDLANHVMLHGDDGKEWRTWLTAADALDLERGPRHYFSDAHLSIGAALHGHGVALGDTVTVSGLLARGQLIAPFGLSVPATDDFYVICRNEMRSAPIVQVFIDWLFAEKEATGDRPTSSVATALRMRHKRQALKKAIPRSR